MIMNYQLSIYEPEETRAFSGDFFSTCPFATISVGDILNAQCLNMTDENKRPLVVKAVEHKIWNFDENQITHQIFIYTEEYKET